MIIVYLWGRKRRYFSLLGASHREPWLFSFHRSNISYCTTYAYYQVDTLTGLNNDLSGCFTEIHFTIDQSCEICVNVSFTSWLSNFLLVPVFDYVHVRNCLESVMERNVTERNSEHWVSALPRFTTFLGNLNTKFYVIVIIIVKICMCDWFNYVTQSDQFCS